MCKTGKISPELYEVAAPQNLLDLLDAIDDDLVLIDEKAEIKYACQDVESIRNALQ